VEADLALLLIDMTFVLIARLGAILVIALVIIAVSIKLDRQTLHGKSTHVSIEPHTATWRWRERFLQFSRASFGMIVSNRESFCAVKSYLPSNKTFDFFCVTPWFPRNLQKRVIVFDVEKVAHVVVVVVSLFNESWNPLWSTILEMTS
jgi:hypothetical protein